MSKKKKIIEKEERIEREIKTEEEVGFFEKHKVKLIAGVFTAIVLVVGLIIVFGIGSNKLYENGEVVYFNPTTGKKCNDYKKENSIEENTEGCLKWYAFNDDEDAKEVALLLDHNTRNRVKWNASGEASDGPKEIMDALTEDVSKWDSEVRDTARLLEANEVAKITGNVNWDSKNKDAKLYYFETNSSDRGECEEQEECLMKFSWLYDGDSNYWTSSANLSIDTQAWTVNYFDAIMSARVDRDRGLRPVITVSKKSLK